jgi:hypothetical protein
VQLIGIKSGQIGRGGLGISNMVNILCGFECNSLSILFVKQSMSNKNVQAEWSTRDKFDGLECFSFLV